MNAGGLHLGAFERAITAVFAQLAHVRLFVANVYDPGAPARDYGPIALARTTTPASARLCAASGLRAVSGFPIDEGRTLLEVPEDAVDLLQGAAEVFGDLRGQHVWVR